MRLVALLPALAAASCGTATRATIDDPLAAPTPTASLAPTVLAEPGTWYMSRDGQLAIASELVA